jgi:Holliday junction resolvase
MKYEPWTNEDDRVLRELYPVTETRELAQMLGRTEDAVNARASFLGIKKDPVFLKKIRTLAWRRGEKLGKLWKKEEDDLLRRLYLEEYLPVEEIAKKLNRTVSAIQNRVRILRIYRAGDEANETGDEGEKLAEEYFKEKGWKVLKKGGAITPYDYIVDINGTNFALNVKYSASGNVALDTHNIARLITSGGKPAFLIIDKLQNVYLMPITYVDFRTQNLNIENK